MEAGLGSCFLNHGWSYGGKHGSNMQWPAHPVYRASCKMRNRNQSSQNKRYPSKKIYRPARANLPTSGNDDSVQEKFSNNSIGSLRNTADGLDRIVKPEHTDKSSTNRIGSMEDDAGALDALVEKGAEIDSEISITGLNNSDDNTGSTNEADQSNNMNGLTMLNNYPSVIADADNELSTVRLDDLVGMIRNAQRNIHVINQARIRALEDLEVIVEEKDTLQDEINNLELKLVETDARLRVATQQKVHMELLEDQLQKLQNELSNRGTYDKNLLEESSITSFSDVSGSVNSVSEDLDALKKENASLKIDLHSLKEQLTVIKGAEERINNLERERLTLESSLTELQVKLSASEDEVAKLSSLRSECKILNEKVEDLQKCLDKATKQADQAIFVLQENQELRKKVDKLEQSLKEATIYKLSSEKLQHYNDLMQQKLNILEQRLQKSDEEIHSYVQLYQDSVKEFQDTLDNLKDESKKRVEDKAVKDMPREFWSQLLLMIDAWLLEKKILIDDAWLLREMVWQRDSHICNAYLSCKGKNEEVIISTFLGLLSSPQRSELHVIHIAAEMAPVAKVGGLGDVVTGLGKALQKRGHLVEVILPKYDCMQYELIHDLRVLDVVVESFFDGQLFENKIWTGTVEGLPVYFIEPHHPGNFFWRGQFYGEHDDFKRFSFFSRAALELLLQSGKKPDIIHCHDWQTSFVAPLYWDLYAPKGLNSARICFTCHNFEYQGAAPAWDLGSCGLDVRHLNRPDRMQDNFSHDRVNPIKGAIVFSNIVTTVSPTYSQEVRTAEGGQGLHSTLNTYAKKFVGILNGIDTDTWNPASDTLLEVQYSAFDTDGKNQNKEALKRKIGLAFANGRQPLVGCITRLVPQKGVHLIRHAIYRTLELGGQFVLLGSSPVPKIQREFEDIANQFQNHEHAQLFLKYDESLAHLIYAASDMLIIPSIFEPCGLTQMIAMRYGTIPIARKTGGLNDSVFDVDDDTIPEEFRNGFTFISADEPGFNAALERAFLHYMSNEVFWQQLVEKVMKIDFSWDSSAAVYEELYEKAVIRARASNRSLA